MMSDVHLKCMCGGMEKVKIQDDLKKVNVQCLVEDPQLRTTGIKVTSTNKIIDDLHKQLTTVLCKEPFFLEALLRKFLRLLQYFHFYVSYVPNFFTDG